MADAPAPAPVAPPSAPPSPAPPPAPHEVPINPNPIDAPAPLSSTGPARRQETISKAFERANAQAKLERRGPAEARMGHNQPPEAMEAEKPAKPPQPPLNLKKRPADQEQSQTNYGAIGEGLRREAQARERGEGGRFAPRAGTEGPPQGGARAQTQPVPLPETAPYREPLPRMSERARTEWSSVPESVRGEVHRMHREFYDAYNRLKADNDVFNTVRPYHDLARSQGTSLQQAMTNYVSIEHKLRQDPIGGLDNIVNNLNLRTSDGHRLGLLDVAAYVLGQSPEQHRLMQQQNQQIALAQQLAQIKQQQMLLARQHQQMQYEQRFRHTSGAVNRFADSHPRLDELADLIATEISYGHDLPTAYQRASLLRPATGQNPAAQTRNQPPAAQTRAQRTQDRSISGAPAGAANGATRPRVKTDRRGSIANAMRLASGSF